MSTKIVTATEVIAEVRKVAAKMPDHLGLVDGGGCHYVHKGAPSCIIGHALWNLGVIDAEFENRGINGSGVRALTDLISGIDDTTEDEMDRTWLYEVQESQDSGAEWAHAVAQADSYIESLDDDEDDL